VANAETLNYIATKFSGQIYVAQGNMDGEHKLEAAVKKISAVHYFNSFGETKIDGLKIGFCHHPETGQFYLERERFDYIFMDIPINLGKKKLMVVVLLIRVI